MRTTLPRLGFHTHGTASSEPTDSDRRPPPRAPWAAGRGPGVVIAVSFLTGAVPFTQFAARIVRDTDLREHGGGTVSGSALFEVAGFGPLAAAGILDVAKGAVGPLLAGPRTRPALAALAAGASVAGHNWSPYLAGAGGRGISPAIGALTVTAPPGAAVLLAGLALGKLSGETAIGALASYAALVPVLRRTGGNGAARAGATVLVPMLAKRLTGNRRATSTGTYLWRLLFDRDTAAKCPGEATV